MQGLEKILILDFGSQYTQLIARRIRELNVRSEIVSPSISFEEIVNQPPRGIVLSGGPNSVLEGKIPFNPDILKLPIPILGVCYGMHLLNTSFQGEVNKLTQGEYGKQKISLDSRSALFSKMKVEESVWMSHGDSIKKLAPNFSSIAKSQDGMIAAIENQKAKHYGVQFHPEVTHTENGKRILENFLSICRCQKNWTVENYIEEMKVEIREKVGDAKVISLVSGGVDSTVATYLLFEALRPEQVYPIHIDSGLMRENESQQVKKALEMRNLTYIDASRKFLKSLKGISDPEKKREVIGNLFIEITEHEIRKREPAYLCQGTLYTDLIESGKGCGLHAQVIKSHHNVNPPYVEEKRKRGLIIEPNAKIFKDEVREVGKALKVPYSLIWRHPFPGPGLAIRIIGEVTEERLETLRKADQIYLEEIEKDLLYDKIWQAFAILLPISSVGVMGDQRTYGNVLALRAVTSRDGMTADFFPMPMETLSRVSTRLINEISGINRVVYDTTSKPPGTIEWE